MRRPADRGRRERKIRIGLVGDGDVELSIAVEIGNQNPAGVAAGNDGFRRLKRSVLISQKNADAIAGEDESVSGDDVENSIAVHIGDGRHGSAGHRITD